jgi:hypothetical protein
VGELAAQLDAIDRQQRAAEGANRKAARMAIDALDKPLNELNALADLVASAALLAAGYRRHNRGEWRKQRVQADQSE